MSICKLWLKYIFLFTIISQRQWTNSPFDWRKYSLAYSFRGTRAENERNARASRIGGKYWPSPPADRCPSRTHQESRRKDCSAGTKQAGHYSTQQQHNKWRCCCQNQHLQFNRDEIERKHSTPSQVINSITILLFKTSTWNSISLWQSCSNANQTQRNSTPYHSVIVHNFELHLLKIG